MERVQLCKFGKEIKKKLVDINQSQGWLISQVVKDTGLYFDSSYLYKVMVGKLSTPKVVDSICKILGLNSHTYKT